MKKNSTLIIGGGIVGATLALSLAQNKHPVTLIDARPKLSPNDWADKLTRRDARVYALSLASIGLLKQVGAWQRIAESQRKADYTQMQVWQTNGVGELKFGDLDNEQDNPQQNPQLLGSMVEPFIIEKSLYDGFDDEDVTPYLTHIAGHKVTSLDWLGDGYRVTLDNGDSHTAKLLIGADGRGSMVRQTAGIGLDTLAYHQTAICCAIKTEQPHNATARQVFLSDSILALLPLADVTDSDKADPQHWQSVVWSLPTNTALDLLTLSPQDLAKELAFASGYALGDITDIESIASFPLNAQHAKGYVKPNLALIGDAGHGVHPLAGQGLNLGMLDVIDLVKILQNDFERSGGKNWAEFATLQRYERVRYAHNAMMMHSFSGINWIFGNQFRPIQHLRSEGVSAVSKFKPLMKFFTQKASGV
ncbi:MULTISPECIES: FAD-dependent oxidoreductase [unclassified Moraxella]|uniref:FAD-dependent oxidoreductase n=1 Tax=unclassified Moraxella TaxID=2685852 RepID=UPI003AF8810A